MNEEYGLIILTIALACKHQILYLRLGDSLS